MIFTETIEELEELIRDYENDLANGYIGDSSLNGQEIEWRNKAIVNMACAINTLKDNEPSMKNVGVLDTRPSQDLNVPSL